MIAPINLTPTEKRLFIILADGEWHTKESLLKPVTGQQFLAANTIPTHVDRLRRKLSGLVIQHQKGLGYCMKAVPAGGGNV